MLAIFVHAHDKDAYISRRFVGMATTEKVSPLDKKRTLLGEVVLILQHLSNFETYTLIFSIFRFKRSTREVHTHKEMPWDATIRVIDTNNRYFFTMN